MTEVEILENMLKKCAEAGYQPTPNVTRIAHTKAMLCKEDWKRCPCDKANEARFCISDACKADIEKNDICHCQCYKKV